jgi:RNA polymerase sigma factor (sigma-70 family)
MIDDHRREHPEPSGEINEDLLPTTPGPEDAFAKWPELQDALQQLSSREREVIALRFGADLGGPEIAALTELSLTNVQQILSRSLKCLRSLLEDAGESRP